uniref:Cystatin domain-containing protein n=1 Tax=Panagrellus redivivus TaxID=6233 RepID=A0A7E4UNM1_PANRE
MTSDIKSACPIIIQIKYHRRKRYKRQTENEVFHAPEIAIVSWCITIVMKPLAAAFTIFVLAYVSNGINADDDSIVLEYVNRTSDEFHRDYRPKFVFRAMVFLGGDVEEVDTDGRIRRKAHLKFEFSPILIPKHVK